MNKLKKLLKKSKQFIKKRVADSKKRTADRKLDKLYEARLDLGLTMLGVKDKNNGFYRYYTYRWFDSPKESFKKSLSEEAKEIGNEKGYDQAFKTAMATTLPSNRKSKWHWIVGIALIGLFVILLIVLGRSAQNTSTPIEAMNPTTPSQTVCQNTWQMRPSDYTNNRWFANGVVEIKNATTKEDAKKAVDAWLDGVKRDPNLLVGASKYFLGRDVDKTTLFNGDNCATDSTVQLVSELELTIAQAKSVVPENAPTSGYNSGVENDTVVGSAVAGISGDRKAIHISLPSGKELWIMGRCGNVVTISKPRIQYGKTDEVERHEHRKSIEEKKPEVKPEPQPKLTPKSSNSKDYKQPGDDNKKDSGSGTKPKASVSKPAESAPPVVTTSKTGGGSVVDTPTNKPSSETGTTAKDATPASPTPSAPKPNEGGSNDGVVTD